MRKLLFAIFVLCLSITGGAAAQETKPERLWLNVPFESINIRAKPTTEAESVAGAFKGERLEAIGRNADGTWFEVSRPFRHKSIGWVNRKFVKYKFDPSRLPLTDSTTGVIGAEPIADIGLAVTTQVEVLLRRIPTGNGAKIGIVPFNATVPVIGRNIDGTWLRVNYLGTTGWIAGFNAVSSNDLLAAPVASDVPPPAIDVVIIPPEIQLAQLNRLRDYINQYRAFSDGLATFWEMVSKGEIMPCNPPPFIAEFQVSQKDLRELPELGRYAPRANTGIQYVNKSLEFLSHCGVFTPEDLSSAKAAAINARVIFDATLDRLDDLEKNVIK
jgi:hypothetical protein